MRKKLLIMLLVLSMILTMLPIPVMAQDESTTIDPREQIIGFEPLDETEKTVALGTAIEDLDLPETLTATVRINPDTVTDRVYDSEEETTVDIPVIWTSEPEYDMDTEGGYVFTPVIEGYIVNAERPRISVTVSAAKMRGLVGPMVGTEEYNVWVAGIQVTDTNKDNITAPGISTGKVTYDSDNNTLTLADATITYDGNVIYTDMKDLIIVLNGENSVTSNSSDDDCALNTISEGSFTFKGNGSLNARGKYCGIYAFDDIIIESGTITATGEKVGISTNRGGMAISGGNVTAIATTAGSLEYQGYGIAKDHNGELTLTVSGDAEVTAMGIRGAIGPYDRGTINTTHNIKAGKDESNATLVTEINSTHKYVKMTPGYTISGTITDNEGHPIEGATVQIQKDGADFGIPVTTGADGTYTTQSVPNGNYTIKVSKSGYLDAVIENVNVNNSSITGINKTMTPFCMVTFNANGHGTTPEEIIAIKNSTITLPTTPTATGYKFDGWFTKDGADDDWGVEFTEATPVTEDITVYAKWIEKSTVIITEAVQRETYDGTGKAYEIQGTGLTGFTVEYYVNGEYTIDAPINAGKYTVKITRAEDINYKAYSKEITDGLEIKPLQVVIAWSGTEGLVYTGNTVTISANVANKVMGDTVNVTLTGDTGINAGTYRAEVTAVDNANYTIEGGTDLVNEWSIGKGANEWIIPLSIEDWKYGETAKTPVAAGKFGIVQFTYSDSEDGIYTETVPANAGTYYVKATVTGTENYDEITAKESFVITKPTFTITVLNGGHGTASANLISAEEGAEITLTATPNSSYRFKEWSSTDNLTFTEGSKYTATAKFIMPAKSITITASWEYSSSGSGGSSSSGRSINNSMPIIVIPPSHSKPDTPTQGEIKISGIVYSEGSVKVNITAKYITEMFEKAMEDAKKRDNEENGITLVFRVDTGNKTASGIIVNLPKAVQDTIIAKRIVSTVMVVDNPNIQIDMDLGAVEEINSQANSDVNVTAAPTDSTKLTDEAQGAVGSRPVFDLKVNYGSNRQVQNFGPGIVTVTIPYTLGPNEKAENVKAVYIEDNGKVHWLADSVYDREEQLLRFSTNHFSLYGVGYKEEIIKEIPVFTDIENHWAKEDIEFAVRQGLFSGTSETAFSPDMAMTRGMFVTVLGRMAKADVSKYKESSFTDVKSDAYYMGYIEWARISNIINGVGNGIFAPDKSITREQMAVIMQNYAKAHGFTLPKVNEEKTFADSDKISAYAKEAVQQMQMAGIISGKGDNFFDPQGEATRAEVSVVLRRLVELISSDAQTY